MIPFASLVYVIRQVEAEMGRRERGEEPDARFDPIFDSLLDLADQLAEQNKEANP